MSLVEYFLAQERRRLQQRVVVMERALRHISLTADTLSPQEFINNCASALGVDRHEYAGACDPNMSIVELGHRVERRDARILVLGHAWEASCQRARDLFDQVKAFHANFDQCIRLAERQGVHGSESVLEAMTALVDLLHLWRDEHCPISHGPIVRRTKVVAPTEGGSR